MATLTQEKEIGGHTFEVSQLPARKALKTLNRLGKVFGPAIAQALAAFGGNGGEVDLSRLDVGKLGGAIEALFGNLDDKDLDFFVDTFFESATIDGRPLLKQLDVALQGKIDTLLKLLVFAVEVNYGNFTGALAGLVQRAPKAKA
jgi:hypothetical protein